MAFAKQMQNAGSLLSAVDALRNWRALLTLLITFVATSLIFGLAGVLTVSVHFLVGGIFFLAGWAVMFYGVNACGILLMDEAKERSGRSIQSAVQQSLVTSHRLLLVLLLSGVFYLVVLLVLAILLVICRIPFLGPLLFTVVFPLAVITVGIIIFALYFVVLPLAAPAVWDGANTLQALSRLAAIARKRLVNVLMMVLMLFFIAAVISGIIAMIMLSGTLVTGSMSVAILGIDGANWVSFPSLMYGGGSGHMMAMSIGGGVVFAIALVLPALVYVKGCCQIYLTNVGQVDVEGMQEQMQEKFDWAKRKAQQMQMDAMPPSPAKPPVAAPTAAAAFSAAQSASSSVPIPLAPGTPPPASPAVASTAAGAAVVSAVPTNAASPAQHIPTTSPPDDRMFGAVANTKPVSPTASVLPAAVPQVPARTPVMPSHPASEVFEIDLSPPALPPTASVPLAKMPPLVCAVCAAPCLPGDRFCESCGNPLAGASRP